MSTATCKPEIATCNVGWSNGKACENPAVLQGGDARWCLECVEYYLIGSRACNGLNGIFGVAARLDYVATVENPHARLDIVDVIALCNRARA